MARKLKRLRGRRLQRRVAIEPWRRETRIAPMRMDSIEWRYVVGRINLAYAMEM